MPPVLALRQSGPGVIQARAIRRCGELLKQIQRPEQGGRPQKNGGGSPPVSRAQAARDAGLSTDQRKTARRVANIPERDFEAAVESKHSTVRAEAPVMTPPAEGRPACHPRDAPPGPAALLRR